MGSSISITRTIAAPPSAVYAESTNVAQWAEIIPAIDKIEILTTGPIKIGSRFKETRLMFGRPATEEMEFIEMDEPNGYVLLAESHGSRYRTEYKFESVAEGTRLTMTFNAEPLTFFAKIMSVLMKPMLKKMMQLCGKDLDALKAHVESKRSA